MKTIPSLLTAMLLAGLLGQQAAAEGFTDSHVTFYGEVRQAGGAGTILLQSGQLKMTFASQNNPANRVTLEAPLRPTGTGVAKPYSYTLKIPLAYLPEAPRLGDYLSIGRASTDFHIENIQINGEPATLPDGSVEFYGLSFANRADYYRLDLLVHGDSTDADSDGLPDWWERLNGLDPDFADADADSDGDGWSNHAEFLRGSDPQESNLDPELATMELLVPELGEAGCLLQFHDSDSSSAEISLTLDFAPLNGFQARLDGAPLTENTVTLTASALQSGRLTIGHRDPSVRSASLPLTWNDGGEASSGAVQIRVTSPSSADGNDAALWLDAASLPVGETVSSWNDRSGNERNAMQPLEENQPSVVPFGNHHSVQFSAPSSHLFFQDEAIPNGNHTILAAWSSPGSRSDSQVLLSSNRGFLRLDPTAEAVSYPGAPHYQADGIAVRGFESALGAASTSIFRREGNTLQNIFGLSYNGEEIEAEALDPVLPTIGAQRLALPVEDPIAHGFAGSLHELLIFPTALPEQKLRDVHDYLQSKWSGYVTWDFSSNLRPVTLTAAGLGRHIIRGGHGNDDLRGGERNNILSGGPGADTLRGSSGLDTFVFGGVDTGSDAIIDFDVTADTIDLSALFWGETGDARHFLSTRLDTNFSTPVPTLDTILIVQRPDASVQEISLRDTVLGSQQVIELIVEGRIRMGSLSIPTGVALALTPGSEDSAVLRESLHDSFTVEITRTGDGVAGALEVPLGLFEDALGNDFVLEGSTSKDGKRAVVNFDRGETSKQITFRPIPDLETEGVERWETAILPHFRYSVSGGPVARSVSDAPSVHLAVIEANALTSGQPARVRVIRDGTPAGALTVNLELDGTALEGTHINSVPRTITIPAGQIAAELSITTVDGWDGAMTRMALLRLTPNDRYLVGNPHEATIYAAQAAPDPETSGFDRWLTAATGGEISSLIDLLQGDSADRFNRLLRAYAAGQPADDTVVGPGLSFRLVENRPSISSPLSSSAADLRWEVHDSGNGNEWRDVSTSFSQELSNEGLTLLGPPREEGDETNLYRLSFTLERGSQLTSGIERLASSDRYGMKGSASWEADPATGHLTSTAGAPGSTSRLIVQVEDPTLLEFDMSVRDGDGGDLLAFYIDGRRVAETSGDPVQFRRQIDPDRPVLLMWEFHRTSGQAVIGNTTPLDTAGQE